ncbi:hypothetical protein HMPREF9693_05445 [Klebsiella oxytoca 10-5249]|uniref:hypothetical protein n=1 Tax=Klebsiella oxytoca TaxID=571 RepID=UPI00066A9974|nr:hypothetical protein [Klebsiella oxytoca]KMV90413.1 hypothetical protein HMPREF9693_05445 [Klebsiella oxytoca 10-5249]
MNIETVNELIQSLESGELSIKEQKFLKLAKEFRICSASLDAAIKTGNVLADQNALLAAENKRLTDVAQGGAFVMQKALMKYEFGVGMTMQAEDFIRDAREKHPATDRILAEAEASGVEKAINCIVQTITPNHETILKELAQQLREGADK